MHQEPQDNSELTKPDDSTSCVFIGRTQGANGQVPSGKRLERDCEFSTGHPPTLTPDESDTERLTKQDWRGLQVGPYILIRRIGSGGGGVVYEAAQNAPVRRTVAIKFLNNQLIDNTARWETEPAVLAELNHPNLVSIIEAGALPDGTRYLVMKLVQGQRIDFWVQQYRPRPREIVALLLQVARGVEYAHNKSILHRDLKPGNILVTKDGMAVVTDFGLAKHLVSEPADPVTHSGRTIGSLGFLAPEQLNWSGSAALPTVDVYGLGAVLYRLLTGLAPTRVDNWGACVEDLLHRTPPALRSLNPAVSRDLQSICLKCLEKDPANRYSTMSFLADDLQRFLHDLPTVARPVSRIRRVARWARRNSLTALLLFSLGCLLITASVVFGFLWQSAEQNRVQVQNVLDMARTIIQQEDNDADRMLPMVPNGLAYRAKRLTSAIGFLQTLLDKYPEEFETRRRLATLHFQLGQVRQKQGDYVESVVSFRQALDQFQSLRSERPDDVSLLFDVFHSQIGLGTSSGGVKPGDCISYFREALETIKKVVRREPENPDYLDALACQLHTVASVEFGLENYAAARQLAGKSLAQAESLTAKYPARPAFAKHVVASCRALALCDVQDGNVEQARKTIGKAISAARKLSELQPELVENDWMLAKTLSAGADIALAGGDVEEASAMHSESVFLLDECVRRAPDHVAFQLDRDEIEEIFANSQKKYGLLAPDNQ